MTVREVVKQFLEKSGYDGLFNTHLLCACKIDDLGPCEEIAEDCEFGYEEPCCSGPECPLDGDCSFHIVSSRGPTKGGD